MCLNRCRCIATFNHQLSKIIKMNTTVKNVFGLATAVLVLLGVNFATNDNSLADQPEPNAKVQAAQDRPVASLMDFNNAIVDIADKTNPAVVTITTKRTEEVRVFNPFAQFFGNPNREEQTQERIQRGLGSGVIVSEEGYILTNNHVIADVDEISVRLFDGTEVNAKLIGTDPETDIAVVQVEEDNLPTVELGNSDNLQVGSFVLAIGSPLSEDLARTVSFGIVSARGRSLTNLTPYGDYIQTDAAINPGNSGGALIDLNGQLVGINSAIASRSGGNDGIGFAIPVNLAKRIMNDLIEDGEVSRGYLGMYTAGEVDQTMARALGLKDVRGIIVGRVQDGSPAEDAGLKAKDVIVSLNGKEIRSWDSFRTSIASFKPGDEITLGVLRNKDELSLDVTLGKLDQEEMAAVNPRAMDDMSEKLGFRVLDLVPEIRQKLNLENETEGVVVNNISNGSNAYERGLRNNDVIVEVAGNSVSSVAEFYEELEDLENEIVLLTVKRNNLEQYIAFEL